MDQSAEGEWDDRWRQKTRPLRRCSCVVSQRRPFNCILPLERDFSWCLKLSTFFFSRRFNQIVNCCRYFVNQTGKGLVTLLTGGTPYETPKRGQKKGVASSGTQATPEAVELARSCGVNVESLRAFCARFSQQAKSVTWGNKEDPDVLEMLKI